MTAPDLPDGVLDAAVEKFNQHGWYEYTNRCICGERPVDMERHALTAALPGVIAAAKADALEDAAETTVMKWDPVISSAEWANDTFARWLRVRAATYRKGNR